MRMRDALSFITFGLMIALAATYAGSLYWVGLPAQRTDLSMTVADSNSLQEGSNVLLRGVPVGKVHTIAATLDCCCDRSTSMTTSVFRLTVKCAA